MRARRLATQFLRGVDLLSRHKRLSAGRGAEYLVASDLEIAGFTCVLAPAGAPFDVIASFPSGLTRIQVKACCRPAVVNAARSRTYRFGDAGRPLTSYAGQIDLFAFVALDLRCILYAAPDGRRRRINLAPWRFTPEAQALSLREVSECTRS